MAAFGNLLRITVFWLRRPTLCFAGLLNVCGWVYWCYQVKNRQRYVWKAALSVVLVSALVLLEVWDFPPILWTFDAHALWHAGTSPVPILWYR